MSEVRYEVINDDLKDQIKHFDSSNVIQKYSDLGIKVGKYEYIDVHAYKRKDIFPTNNLRIINQYNYEKIEKIAEKLKTANKDYIEKNILTNGLFNQEQSKPKIIISLLEIGSTVKKDESCISIYYASSSEEEAKEIILLLTDNIYITSESNNHFYIKMNYEYLQNDCINAINASSATLLANSLNKYLEVYKDYIKAIKINLGDYSYAAAYEQSHSLYRLRAYGLLELIAEDIRDYTQSIVEQDSARLLNELISFLYKSILYSYKNDELLSIQFLYSSYDYINYHSVRLTDDRGVYNKIELELFDFIGKVKYDINSDNMEFCKNVLLVCNKTISSVLFELSKKDDKRFFEFLRKISVFIDGIHDKLIQIQHSKSESSVRMMEIYKEIFINYNCNFFATLSYITANWEKQDKNTANILNTYDKYNIKEITDILLNTLNKDYNDKTYHWELLDDHDLEDCDGRLWNVNTQSYLQHLYCLLLDKRNPNDIKLPLSYALSTHSDDLIKEFKKLGNEILIDKIDELTASIDNAEKEYIRKTPISPEKVSIFKNKFAESYYKNAELYKLLKGTNNFNIVKDKRRNTYIGLSNIVEKTYFLSKTPNDRHIIWSDFEETFANAFIRAEEEKYSSILEEKSAKSNLSISKYLKNRDLIKNKYIIFADNYAIYNILKYPNISYGIPNNIKYSGIKSSYYFKQDNDHIPIFSITGLKKDCIYLLNIEELGIIEKHCDGFNIKINDFYNNEKLIKKFMNKTVSGLNLQGDNRRNHLLESVNLIIEEYVDFNSKTMKAIKFTE